MIQRFSIWKTTVVVISLILGTLYGLPNGFPDDPAVQITSNRSTELLSELDVIRAEDALKEAGIAAIAEIAYNLNEKSDAKYMFMVSIKDIKSGQELTANYNLYTYPKTGVGLQML